MPLDRLFLGFLIIFIGCAGGLFWFLRKLWYTQQEIQTALSGAIADQISAGLQPFAAELAQTSSALADSQKQLQETTLQMQSIGTHFENSHENFQKAILTLAEPGTLQNFTDTLYQSIQPLHDIRSGINDHYHTNAQLQRVVSEILHEWLIKQEKIGTDFERIANVLDTWMTDEASSRREMMSRIVDQLQEVTGQRQEVATNLSKLQKEISELVASTKTLRYSVNKIVDSIEHLIKTQQVIVENQNTYLHDLKTIADSLSQTYVQLGLQINTTLDRTNHVLGQYEETLGQFHARHNETLIRLETQHSRLMAGQNDLIENAGGLIDRLPTRKAQTWQIVLLLLLVLSALLLTYLVLSSM
ncbi:MAG: hypothetical protein KC418_05735 [Anaerolineales bacterium]|nr:hypothetical protein [Anaerolineales bacterium]